MASWKRVCDETPELAASVRTRFAANLHHVIGTIRVGGAPRLSGTEVEIDDDEIRVGMMPRSRKLEDVRRDPRVEIHSAPLEEDLHGGDAKLAGRLVEAGPVEGQPGSAFTLDLERVSLVQVIDEELVLTTWRSGAGVTTTRRT